MILLMTRAMAERRKSLEFEKNPQGNTGDDAIVYF
jgi:hypothetical protein